MTWLRAKIRRFFKVLVEGFGNSGCEALGCKRDGTWLVDWGSGNHKVCSNHREYFL